MATTVTKVIDPDAGTGYDYTSLSAWEAAQQGDLTGVRDEIATAKCRCTGGTADTAQLLVDGWTVDSTRYIKIWTDPAESYRHNGTYQTGNKYRIESSISSGDHLRVSETYTIVEGLQFSFVAAGGGLNWRGLLALSASDSVARFHVFKGESSTYSVGLYVGATGATNMLAYRNIAYDFTGSGVNPGIGIAAGDDINSTNMIVQNTIYNCTYGFQLNAAPLTLKQNYVGASGTYCYVGAGSATTAKNISSDDTSPDGATYRSKNAYSDYFVDYANKNFHLKSTDTVLKDAGDNLGSPFNTDIDGQVVSGTWDIGADEYVVLSSGITFGWFRL